MKPCIYVYFLSCPVSVEMFTCCILCRSAPCTGETSSGTSAATAALLLCSSVLVPPISAPRAGFYPVEGGGGGASTPNIFQLQYKLLWSRPYLSVKIYLE